METIHSCSKPPYPSSPVFDPKFYSMRSVIHKCSPHASIAPRLCHARQEVPFHSGYSHEEHDNAYFYAPDVTSLTHKCFTNSSGKLVRTHITRNVQESPHLQPVIIPKKCSVTIINLKPDEWICQRSQL